MTGRLIVGLLFLGYLPLYAQSVQEQTDSFIQQVISDQGIPGLSLAMVADGKLVYAQGYGVADLAKNAAVDTQTVFQLDSLSHTVVAVAVMQLVEAGCLSLDGKVADYLPSFKMGNPLYREITLRHLLNHTSGLPRNTPTETAGKTYNPAALDAYIRSLSTATITGQPGGGMSYSFPAFDLLGAVVAQASKTSFEKYAAEHIFSPLVMTQSTFLPGQIPASHKSQPHTGYGETTLSPIYPYDAAHGPSSAWHASAKDLTRWMQFMLEGGSLDGKQVLKPETVGLLLKSSTSSSPLGLGWFLNKHRDLAAASYGGGDLGFRTFMILIPEKKIGVAIAANYDGFSPDAVAKGLADILLGHALEFPKIPIARVFLASLREKGYDMAVSEYKQLAETGEARYMFGERELNRLGYSLLANEAFDESLQAFRLNAELFPESIHSYIGLGAAYAAAGKKSEAIANYKKANAMNPAEQDVLAELKKLGQ